MYLVSLFYITVSLFHQWQLLVTIPPVTSALQVLIKVVVAINMRGCD